MTQDVTSGRTVLVTGASSDIGLAVCRKYLDAGWRVVGHYRELRPELARLMEDHPRLEGWHCDFSDPAAIPTALTADPGRFEAIDALVNLAAELRPCRFATATPDDLLRALTINLLPGLLLTQRLVPGMMERGWGRIVHASSIGVAKGGGPDSFAYALSKHALEFMPADHRQWAGAGVLTNVLRIGVTDTRIHGRVPGKDMTARIARIPIGRPATPEEMADAVLWLGTERNAFTTGQTIAVAGGE